MDAIDGIRRSCPRRSVRTALPPAASPPMSCDTGRAAAGRAGSFNSGKNRLRGSGIALWGDPRGSTPFRIPYIQKIAKNLTAPPL